MPSVPAPDLTSRFARLARWCITHRWQTFVLWVLLLVVAIGAGSSVSTKRNSDFRLSGTESQHAYDILKQHSPQANGIVDQFVFSAKSGTLRDAANRTAIAKALTDVRGQRYVQSVTSPASELSTNGKVGVSTLTYSTANPQDLETGDFRKIQKAAFKARSSGLEVEHGGPGAEQIRFADEGGGGGGIGFLFAFIVLIITFGSVIAAGVPLVTAGVALGVSLGLVPLLSHVMNTPDFASQLAELIGLGVGVDYALIILTRYRAEHAGGLDRQSAIVKAIDTAGRTVFFAGCTVIIALLGLLLLGLSFLYGVAVASALCVLLTMVSALTMLPVLLSRAGGWIDRLRVPLPRRRASVEPATDTRHTTGAIGEGRGWARWASTVQAHPVPAAIVSLVVLLALAAPALGMRLGNSDASLDPSDSTTHKAYEKIADGFGAGVNGSFLLAVELPKRGDAGPARQIAAAAAKDPGVVRVLPPRTSKDGAIATVTLYPKSGPQDKATTDLLDRLRGGELKSIRQSTGAKVSIGGQTASQEDFTDVLAGKLPLFIGVVVLLSALLLMTVFRSIFIPVKAAIMNLLSIGASLGFLTLVFQKGHGASVIGTSTGPIESFVPVMLFAIVFGLSMDYEVFLISRVHEEWTKTKDASRAVRAGLSTTGRVITAAASIMVVVFASFLLLGERIIAEFGLGLAIAVLLDALVIRCLLVPAIMELAGRAAWYVPAWLERLLPKLAIEGEGSAAMPRDPDLDRQPAGS